MPIFVSMLNDTIDENHCELNQTDQSKWWHSLDFFLYQLWFMDGWMDGNSNEVNLRYEPNMNVLHNATKLDN